MLPESPERLTVAGSLSGLRVLDFSRVFAGPYCTQMLADLGAEVLKIERPGAGDDTRAWGPPFHGDQSAYFLCLNRGKRSLELDLGSDDGLAQARELAARADVLVENFRTGWMKERGLDYDALRERNPGLVYCSITGCGQDGPDAGLPGYDFLIQARSGLMSITGDPAGPPMKVGVAVSDLIAGLHAAAGILAALHRRSLTGEGACIDVSLLDCQVAGLANVAGSHLVSGAEAARLGNEHPNIVPYQVFHAADGPFVLAVGNDGQWRRCCEALGRPDLAAEERFSTNPSRVRHRAELAAILSEVLARRPRDAWLRELRRVGVPAGPVQTVSEALRDPQVLARGMIQASGPVPLVANPLLREETPSQPPPALGEGGAEMAARWLSGAPTAPRQ